MTLPFTPEQFLAVFKNYNEAVFPAQFILYALGLIAVLLVFQGGRGGRVIATILAVMWLWTGVVYFILFFTALSPGGYLFGGVFVLQGLLFARAAGRGALHFAPGRRTIKVAGWSLVVYAMVIYPLLGRIVGHDYPEIPTFGLPCPLTIFTFGLFLLTNRSFGRRLLAIPTLWALFGSSAVVLFGVYQDIGLLVSAIVTWAFILPRDRRR